VSFDASILVIMGIFWISYFILRVFFFLPMVRLLDEREARVSGAQQRWDQKFAETQKRLDDERSLLAETRRKAMQAREQRRREAQDRRLAILGEVKKSVQAELAEASATLAAQVGRERAVLDGRVRSLADQIVRRLLGNVA
jgi:F0F1-type ATP synthase membrane subunit b/b'